MDIINEEDLEVLTDEELVTVLNSLEDIDDILKELESGDSDE